MNYRSDEGLYAGEFAALYGISKDTLLYYDRIGLFCPKLRAPNGYRLYSLDQVHTFDLLMMLRSTNLPLEEIAVCLQDYNPQQVLSLLRTQAEQLSAQIADMQRLHEKIVRTADMVQDGLMQPCGVPRLETRQEAFYLSIRTTPEILQNRRLRMAYVRRHLHSSRAQALASSFLRNGIVRQESLEQRRFTKDYFCARVDTPSVETPCEIIVQPCGNYAVIEHKGPYETLDQSYSILLAFMRDQGLRIAGNGYETEVLGYAAFPDSQDYVIQIAILAKAQ